MERQSKLTETIYGLSFAKAGLSPTRLKFLLLNIFVNCQLFTFGFLLYYYAQHYGLPYGGIAQQQRGRYSADQAPVDLYSYSYLDSSRNSFNLKNNQQPSASYYSYYSTDASKTLLDANQVKEVRALNNQKSSTSTVRPKGKKDKGRLGAALTLLLIKKHDRKISPAKEVTVVMEKRLGSGGFCEVYMGEYNGKKYAFRIAKQKHKDPFSFIKTGYQYNYLFSQQGICPKVTALFQLKNEPVGGYMMRLMKGDLYAASKLPFHQRVEIAHKLIGQVERLHGMHYFHGDIKPGNILLDDSFNPFISDVDSVSYFGENADPSRIAGGTRGYRDPQLARHKQALKAKNIRVTYPKSLLEQADVFSTTITVYYLLFKRSLFGHVVNAIDCGRDYNLPSGVTFTSNVADNFGEFLEKFFQKFFLSASRNPQLYADPIVRLLDNGLFTSKSLQKLRENLSYITSADVQRWTSLINDVTPEKLPIQCNIERQNK